MQEFKEFAMRGSVIDLAVGVVVGGAFSKIVSTLVDDLIMPPLSLLTGGINFSDKLIVLKPASAGVKAVTLNYGDFLTNLLDFLLIAFVIFLLIKQINNLKRLGQKPADPTTKNCPYCFSIIPIKATKCSACTADLPNR